MATHAIDDAWPQYAVERFTEDQNPDGALRAQQIQAESFIDAGYLHPTAMRDDGTLAPELDPSRGPNVTYFLATRDGSEPVLDQACAGLAAPPTGEGYKRLRAYEFMSAALRLDSARKLDKHSRQFGASSVREIAALAKTTKAGSSASFAVIRAMIEYVFAGTAPQLWLAVLVPQPFAALRISFGEFVVQQVGDPIPGYPGNPHAPGGLRFIPTLIDVNRFPDAMLRAIRNTNRPEVAARVSHTLRYMATALPSGTISDEVVAYLEGTPSS